MKKFLLAIIILLLASTTLLLLATQGEQGQRSRPADNAGEGKALIGGDFHLTDQNGKQVSDADYRGKIMLVFFGFTHCPDICPVTVSTLHKVLDSLGDKADQAVVLFITVDPERDTPQVLASYLGNVDKRMIGLTGTPEQIKQAASAYKAYFAKSATPVEKAEDAGEEHEHHHDEADHGADHDHGEYVVDHSGFVYVMDANGVYVRHFAYDAPAAEITEALTPMLK